MMLVADPFRLALLTLVSLSVLAPCANSQGQSPSADSAAALRALGSVETELNASTATQAEIAQRMAEAIRAQEAASARLVDLARTERAQEATLARIARRLDDLHRSNAKALLALAEKRDAMSKLLAGLQRLERNPPPALVVAPDDVLQALRGAMMFGAVIPQLRQETDDLRAALADVEALRADLETEKRRSTDALAALEETRGKIALAVAERQAAAAAGVEQLAVERQKSQALGEKAKSLKDLIVDLERARLAEEERLKDLREKAEAEAQAQAQAAAQAEVLRQAALAKPAMAFTEAKGKLDYPAAGEPLRSFGDDNGLGGRTSGLFLRTAVKAQVLSPVDGRIEFAGKFRTYEQLVIINPGQGYLVLLAGMDEITLQPGQSVKAGEPVAVMGEKPSEMAVATGLTNAATPVLYVEFRKQNEPIDPSPWWKDRRKEASR